MKKKTIITYGTFDMFHIGHLNLLKRLKVMGDELIVGVSTDEFNLGKGKKTLIPYDQRAEIVAAIEYVDKVIPENNWEQKVLDIKEFDVDIFVIGDDWHGKFDFLKEFCEVQYLDRTRGVSTTMLKDSLSAIKKISKEDLINALDILERLRDDLA
jgi:glycerol-3-phosphate cytidylyltransferase